MTIGSRDGRDRCRHVHSAQRRRNPGTGLDGCYIRPRQWPTSRVSRRPSSAPLRRPPIPAGRGGCSCTAWRASRRSPSSSALAALSLGGGKPSQGENARSTLPPTRVAPSAPRPRFRGATEHGRAARGRHGQDVEHGPAHERPALQIAGDLRERTTSRSSSRASSTTSSTAASSSSTATRSRRRPSTAPVLSTDSTKTGTRSSRRCRSLDNRFALGAWVRVEGRG